MNEWFIAYSGSMLDYT